MSAVAAKCFTGLDNEAIPFLHRDSVPLGQHGGMAFGCVGFAHCGHQGCNCMERRTQKASEWVFFMNEACKEVKHSGLK